MTDHAPFSDFDLALVTNCVTRYQEAGLVATCDVHDRNAGIVHLMFTNPARRDGTLVLMEIHKLSRQGLFWRRAHWVVQLWSMEDEDADPVKRGCSFGSTQAAAVTEAERDIRANFLSKCSFELALKA